MATVTVGAGVSTKVVGLLDFVAQTLGKSIALGQANAFRLVLECTDGDTITLRQVPLDTSGTATKTADAVAGAQISAAADTAGDANNANISTGTATLVASTKDVSVPAPALGAAVPAGSTVFATVTTPGGTTKVLAAARKDNSTITISSAGPGFGGSSLDADAVLATLVAGLATVTTPTSAATDKFVAVEMAAGGSAADGFGVVRIDATSVQVVALDTSGAVVTGNTSSVNVYNIGSTADETSVVRWCVVRP